MQPLNTHVACITALENAYATMADPTAPWPYDALMLALTMGAANSRQIDHRHYRMAANALATIPAVQRDALAGQVQIPANLLSAAEAPPDWPDPEPVKTLEGELPVDLAVYIRSNRDKLLEASDWAMLPDAPTDKPAWETYRQALRDLPQQPGFPEAVAWPVAPA